VFFISYLSSRVLHLYSFISCSSSLIFHLVFFISHSHDTVQVVLPGGHMERRVPVDVGGVEVASRLQQRQSHVVAARERGPVEAHVLLLEVKGQRRGQRSGLQPSGGSTLCLLLACRVLACRVLCSSMWLACCQRVVSVLSACCQRVVSVFLTW